MSLIRLYAGRRPSLACLVAVIWLAAAPAAVFGRAAAAEPAEEKPTKELPPLTVEDEVTVTDSEAQEYAAPAASTLKIDTPLLLVPQAVQVVRRGVLDDQRTLNLAEAVRNVAGTATDFGFNGSSQPLLILRGFPSTSMSASGAMSGAIGYYLDGTKVQGIPVSMANVDRVEVVKGPASVLYGRAEPGGLINVVTKAPSGQRALDFEQMAGTDGLLSTALSATGALSADERWIGRLAASYLDEGGDRDFVVNRNRTIDGDLAWRLSPESSLTFSAHFIDQRYRNDYGVPALGDRPADLLRSRQFNDAPELSRIRATTGRVELDHLFSPGWRLSARALALASDTREVDIVPYRLDLATFDDCLATRNELCRYYFGARPDGEYELWQVNADLIGDIELGGRRHQIVFGADTYSAGLEGRRRSVFGLERQGFGIGVAAQGGDHRQREVDAGGDPGAGDDVAVPHYPLGHRDRPEIAQDLVGHPVAGGSFAGQQAGHAQQQAAGADAGDPLSLASPVGQEGDRLGIVHGADRTRRASRHEKKGRPPRAVGESRGGRYGNSGVAGHRVVRLRHQRHRGAEHAGEKILWTHQVEGGEAGVKQHGDLFVAQHLEPGHRRNVVVAFERTCLDLLSRRRRLRQCGGRQDGGSGSGRSQRADEGSSGTCHGISPLLLPKRSVRNAGGGLPSSCGSGRAGSSPGRTDGCRCSSADRRRFRG